MPTSVGAVDDSARARLHATFGRDLVYRYRLDDGAFEYISPSASALTGYEPAAFLADPQLFRRLVHPDDAHLIDQRSGRVLAEGQPVRWVRRDGAVILTRHSSVVVTDEAGVPEAVEGVVRNDTDLLVALESFRGQEHAVWQFLAAAARPAVALDGRGVVVFVNGAFGRLTGRVAEDVVGKEWVTAFEPSDVGASGRSLVPGPAGGWTAGASITTSLKVSGGRVSLIAWTALPLGGRSAPLTAFLGEDVSAERELLAIAAQFKAAADHAHDSVLVTDMQGRIVYVNAAFEAATGRRASQVLGQNPRILKSGEHAPEHYAGLWWTITHGGTWRGELADLRADGSLLVQETSITPVRDDLGVIIAYVSVQHDVAPMRTLRASIDEARQQRERLTASLERVALRDSIDETCRDIAQVVAELPAALMGGVALVEDDGSLRLAATASRTLETSGGWLMPPADVASVLLRANAEPWVEPVTAMADRVRSGALRAAGVEAVMYVPVRQDGRALGAIVVGGADRQGSDLKAQLLAIGQIGAVLRAVLGPATSPQAARRDLRERVKVLAAPGESSPVYQPIRDMVTGRIAGFEALTRFRDGTPADRAFADAAACGLSDLLELATLRSSVATAASLPRDTWLSLNVSARLLTAGGELPIILRSARRELIVEVGDAQGGADLAAARRAVEAISRDIRLAVDDAGGGAADFRHLVDLRPDFIKLGTGLVRGIDRDFTRQAVVAGLRQVAQTSGGGVIAEGIETADEQAALVRLGVPFGQGYHLGRPEPADAWRGSESRRLSAR